MQKHSINIVKPSHPDAYDISPQFQRCIETGQVTNNCCNVREFEDRLHDFFGSVHKPIAFCNGEMALYTLIRAQKILRNIPDGAGCLVPSLTFSGTLAAITLNNLRPVFCDVDDTLTIDNPGAYYDPSCRMIVAVGAYGNLPDLDHLREFARDYDLALVLDAAPAFGSKYNNQYPQVNCIYSFHATKTFSTMEGGCAVVDSVELYDLMIQLRDFGQYEKQRGGVRHAGLNGKMMEICAIVGIENLKTFKGQAERKQWVLREYMKRAGIYWTMRISESVMCNPLYFPILCEKDAAGLIQHLADNGIQARRYYTACHDLEAYRSGEYVAEITANELLTTGVGKPAYFKSDVTLPFTDAIKDRIVALPIHWDMTIDEINYLFETIKTYAE